jgi:hypothetical protein
VLHQLPSLMINLSENGASDDAAQVKLVESLVESGPTWSSSPWD